MPVDTVAYAAHGDTERESLLRVIRGFHFVGSSPNPHKRRHEARARRRGRLPNGAQRAG